MESITSELCRRFKSRGQLIESSTDRHRVEVGLANSINETFRHSTIWCSSFFDEKNTGREIFRPEWDKFFGKLLNFYFFFTWADLWVSASPENYWTTGIRRKNSNKINWNPRFLIRKCLQTILKGESLDTKMSSFSFHGLKFLFIFTFYLPVNSKFLNC